MENDSSHAARVGELGRAFAAALLTGDAIVKRAGMN
jgi:hypothetical protein